MGSQAVRSHPYCSMHMRAVGSGWLASSGFVVPRAFQLSAALGIWHCAAFPWCGMDFVVCSCRVVFPVVLLQFRTVGSFSQTVAVNSFCFSCATAEWRLCKTLPGCPALGSCPQGVVLLPLELLAGATSETAFCPPGLNFLS